MSTEAVKAFYRVAWEQNGNKMMMSWLSTLYQNPQAKLKINGALFEPIIIKNETREGCPLFLLLLILTLGSFIRTINFINSMHSLTVTGREYELAANAVDLLFFITYLHISILNLTNAFKHFKYLTSKLTTINLKL